MRALRLFNPDNDLALASDCVAFTPPAAATQLRLSGALLPAWLSSDDDIILADTILTDSLHSLSDHIGKKLSICSTKALLSDYSSYRFQPWGWNKALVHTMQRMNYGGSLPTTDELNTLRNLSGREITEEVNRRLDPDRRHSCPIKCSTPQSAFKVLNDLQNQAVVKQPWSSSGRGVFPSSLYTSKQLSTIIEGTIRRQGYVMIERELNRITDCAALYFINHDGLYFKGLSVFSNHNFSAYAGNIIAPQSVLAEMISSLVGSDRLDTLISKQESVLKEILAPINHFYHGWVGVDMLVHRDKNHNLQLSPCIEINLRSTMGVVALKAQEIIHFNSPHEMKVIERRNKAPGTFEMSPVEGSRFAFIISK